MIFTIFTELCDHHHCLITEHFYHLQKKPMPISSHSTLPLSQSQASSDLLSISIDLLIYNITYELSQWLSGKESACQCQRCKFRPWIRKIPWRRKWQPTAVFLPGRSHGERNLMGYTVHGDAKKSDMT